ncbi:SNF2-related protein [Penicillium sp. DV-2018c]|nr:SNF2-related protein [Penicillium sp. DV-2018c]KAJ5567258.1 SNF2-related protein [Penicillium sp. DV-2018c]
MKDATDAALDHYIPVGVIGKSVASYAASEIALLEKLEWIRTYSLDNSDNLQIFALPDAERRHVPPQVGKAKAAFKLVMSKIDSSPEAWNSLVDIPGDQTVLNGEEDESLWYMFNTLQSPSPALDSVQDVYSWEAMDDLLHHSVLGLNTQLHQYQRRSAALMVQREAQPAFVLDPRLQVCQGPTGVEYYYDKEAVSLFREKILYPEACGGILAEPMGYGKTLISLAVILATRGHFPKVPVEYQTTTNPVRDTTGTLMQMAAAAACRFSIPWKQEFQRQEIEGKFRQNCIRACESHSPSYMIPAQHKHQSRASSSYTRPAKRILLCSGTIVVAPLNLVNHWESEISTHTSGLKVLVLRDKSSEVPSVEELLSFDIVLFSKNRFTAEVPKQRAKDTPKSPILKLHWLRVIIDEGHDVAGQRTDMVHLLQQLHFERRWVISGTPSRGLYGVELNSASQRENISGTESSSTGLTAGILQRRKKTGPAIDDEVKDLQGLGRMVVDFLDLKPWSNDRRLWPRYTNPVGEDGIRRKAHSLRATLQSFVVRHPLDVILEEVTLPPMSHEVVYLTPTFYDRLNINLFIFSLAVNAITSERTGPDYMFDPRNRKNLEVLIGNLRQAGFWWVGSGKDIGGTVDIATEYLEKNREKMSMSDIGQLSHGIQIAQKAMGSSAWNEFNSLHELGVYIWGFPEHARSLWALDRTATDQEPLLMGINQARRAQEFVSQHLRTPDPAEGLAGHGIKVRQELARHGQDQHVTHIGAPESASQIPQPVQKTTSKKRKPRHTFEKKLFRTLPDSSPLKQTVLQGVTSAKLRYLLEKVLEYQQTEKIIIFFEDDNTAVWVAEGLELIASNFRIYANSKSLNPKLRDKYLNLFRDSDEVRVLLMDLKQAAYGLHISEASRVFIINPIWEPTIESQAIKRAHRIGQTTPVRVETLVLEGTIEDALLRRRKEMSEVEMQSAKTPLDDGTMSDIIRNAGFLPMGDENGTAMAALGKSIGIFDRHPLPIPDDEEVPDTVRETSKRRVLPVVGVLGSDADEDEDDVDVDVDVYRWQTERAKPDETRRIGFVGFGQILNEGEGEDSAGMVQPLQLVSGSDSFSGAGVPVSEDPMHLPQRVRDRWDGLGSL